MDRRLLFPVAAATAWAQQTSPAAAKAEKALRERVQQFYQLQLDKKYRQAEAMVADDTRDDYYASKKPDIKGFSIEKIQLLDGNTKAKVIIKAKVVMLFPGAGAQIFETPTPTEWKLENGEWRWYISEEAKAASPFGRLKTTAGGAIDNKGQAPGGIEHPNLGALEEQIAIDSTAVEFSAEKPEGTVTISNGLPGPITLRIDPHADTIKGLTVKADKMTINSGEKSVVTFHREGSGPLSDFVQITAQPFSKVFTIRLIGK